MGSGSLIVTLPVGVQLMELAEQSAACGEEVWGFVLGEQLNVIAEVLDGWMEAEHKYVRVRVKGGQSFILRHDPGKGEWTASALLRTPGA